MCRLEKICNALSFKPPKNLTILKPAAFGTEHKSWLTETDNSKSFRSSPSMCRQSSGDRYRKLSRFPVTLCTSSLLSLSTKESLIVDILARDHIPSIQVEGFLRASRPCQHTMNLSFENTHVLSLDEGSLRSWMQAGSKCPSAQCHSQTFCRGRFGVPCSGSTTLLAVWVTGKLEWSITIPSVPVVNSVSDYLSPSNLNQGLRERGQRWNPSIRLAPVREAIHPMVE